MAKTEDSFEYKLAKEQTIVFIWQSVMQDYEYKTKDMNLFYEQVKDIVPQRADFFINWFKGFTAIADHDFEAAQKLYSSAFDNIEKAEEYSGRFVQQGFTLFMYCQQKEKALKIWDYGIKLKMVQPLDDNFFDSFNIKEQFWTQFAPAMFKDKNWATEHAVNDYKKFIGDKIQASIERCDSKKFKSLTKDLNFNSYKIEGVSPLYYAIQFKATLKAGSLAYAEGMVDFRTQQLASSMDFHRVKEDKKQETILTIRHNMKQTYLESGLGQIMFQAYYCKDEEIPEKTAELEKIISYIIENTDNVDDFKANAGAAMKNTALYLAAEVDDSQTAFLLLKKGARDDKPLGFASISFNKKDGTVRKTDIPNTFIYRLISFHSWNTLELYLKDFKKQAEPQMTQVNEKYNITPLVYFIMSTIYSARSEPQFNQSKELADSLLPLFQNAGAKLEQNTAFGTAKQLLGM